MLDQLFGGGALALGQHDEGLGPLTPLLVGHADHRRLDDRRVRHDGLLHLDRRDVLATGDDDVLGAIAQLDIAVRMHHAQVAGVEPAARERLLGAVGVLVVALHDVVAAHHDLAHRRAVGGDVVHVVVDHAHPIGADHADALAGLLLGAVGAVQLVRAVRVDRVRTVGLGEPVDVHDPEAPLLGRLDRGRRRGRARRRDDDRGLELRGGGVAQDGRDDGRRAVEVGDAVLADQLPDRVAADLAQAHVGAADRRDRPRRAPAVAVEHRQRPEVDALGREHGVHDLAERVQVRTAVVVHHALGAPGRPRGVVDRDGGVLVVDGPRQGVLTAAGQQVVVGDAGAGAVAGARRVDHRDDLFDGLERTGDRRDRRMQGRVDHQQLRAGMVEDVADLVGGQPRVDRDEHRARQWHREVRHQHLGDVGQEVGHPVAGLDAGAAQGVRDPGDLSGELPVGVAPVAVEDGRALREDLGGAAQERQRGQLRVPDGRHGLILIPGPLSRQPIRAAGPAYSSTMEIAARGQDATHSSSLGRIDSGGFSSRM